MTRVSPWPPVLALLAAMLLWASSFVALKVAFRGFDPMAVIFGRMAVGSLGFLLLWRRPWSVPWRRRDLKYVAFMALCEPCLYFLFEARALELTSASQAGMVTALLPPMVAVAAGVFLKERVTGRMLAGFALAGAGVCGLSLGARVSGDAPAPLAGNALEFLAMVCATGYTVTLRSLTARISPLLLTGMQALVGALFFLPFLLFSPAPFPVRPDPLAAAAVVYLGLAVTLGAYGLYNFGVSRVPASRAAAFVNLIPVFAVALGWLLLGDRFTPAQWGASALVFAGLYLSRERAARPAAAPIPP